MQNTYIESFKACKLQILTKYILDQFDEFVEERKEYAQDFEDVNYQDIENLSDLDKIETIRTACFDDRMLQDPYGKSYDQQIEIIKGWLLRHNYPIEHREYKIKELFDIDLDDYWHLIAEALQKGNTYYRHKNY